jgi:hypothetical protein
MENLYGMHRSWHTHIHNLITSHRFNFEDIRKLPPPIIAFDKVAFSYSGQKKDYLYEKLSFGIEYAIPFLSLLVIIPTPTVTVVWTPA